MGEFLTKATIWIAMSGWAGAIFTGRFQHRQVSRVFWSVGFFFYLFHILFAYDAFYHWDNRIAWEMTAADTERLVGVRSGFGLIVNFLFLALLLVNLFRQWSGKGRWIGNFFDAFVIFMIINGAVVFGSGAVRWFGVMLLVLLLGSFFLSSRSTRKKESKDKE